MVSGQRNAPAAWTPRKTRYALYRRLGGPQGRSGWVRSKTEDPKMKFKKPKQVKKFVGRTGKKWLEFLFIYLFVYLFIYLF